MTRRVRIRQDRKKEPRERWGEMRDKFSGVQNRQKGDDREEPQISDRRSAVVASRPTLGTGVSS